jgi:hypothetical protein
MNRSIFTRLKARLQPRLDIGAGTGVLTADEHRTVHALLQVLAGDAEAPAEPCRAHVDGDTSRTPGLLAEFRSAVTSLDAGAAALEPGTKFADLDLVRRDQVLRSIVKPFPHPESEPPWRRLSGLTSDNLDLLLSPRWRRRFREHVVRNLLGYFHRSARGWAIVGYEDYPGKVKAEDMTCEVLSFKVVGRSLVLELSDGTYDRMDPATLQRESGDRLSVKTKAGRQKAVFARAAHDALLPLIEGREGTYRLRVHDVLVDILR